jgi:hypothetical protein
MSIPSVRTDKGARNLSTPVLSAEVAGQAQFVIGKLYSCSTADKFEILRYLQAPHELEPGPECRVGHLLQIRQRLEWTAAVSEAARDAVRECAGEMLRASLPSYVSLDSSSRSPTPFESQLREVMQQGKVAALLCCRHQGTQTMLWLYGFSLYGRYRDKLGHLVEKYESLKEKGGGLASVELGHEYTEAFNRVVLECLEPKAAEALADLAQIPSYDLRKQLVVQVLESALSRFNRVASQ